MKSKHRTMSGIANDYSYDVTESWRILRLRMCEVVAMETCWHVYYRDDEKKDNKEIVDGEEVEEEEEEEQELEEKPVTPPPAR